MSNPAVIKLQSGTVSGSSVWLDDNFGESIHIHIDNYRVDLTVTEFGQLYTDLCRTLNTLIDVDGFDISKIDPVYLSLWLWPYLPDLTAVSFDNVHLEDMYTSVHSVLVPLKDSLSVKYLRGISNENNSIDRPSNLMGQDDNERTDTILESIKNNGYPYDGNYIIMYGNDNIIQDGQHRASCLYYLYGNIEVPVMRLHFRNYKPPVIDKHYNDPVRVFYREDKYRIFLRMKHIKDRFVNGLEKVKRLPGRIRRAQITKTAAIPPDISDIFHSK